MHGVVSLVLNVTAVIKVNVYSKLFDCIDAFPLTKISLFTAVAPNGSFLILNFERNTASNTIE
jgi:hypothetical protein